MSETYLITQKMIPKEICTEDKILNAAYKTFLLYGYHGATLQQIATIAGVNKSVIHYYFRSKDKLYMKVVERVIALLISSNFEINSNKEEFERLRWFLFTELYNNKSLFERTLRDLFPSEWEKNLYNIKKLIDFVDNPF